MTVVLALFCPGVASVATGGLDSSLNNASSVTAALPETGDEAFGTAVQANGKIIAVGHSNFDLSSDFALARYNADGSLDTGFDADGTVITDFGGGLDAAYGVVVQADGKIVAAGDTQGTGVDFALARYNTDGSLDDGSPLDSTPSDSFGTGGKVTTDFGGQADTAHGVALQADGRIVVVGTTSSGGSDFAVARYNTDGSLDTGFDNDGRVTTDFESGTSDDGRGVALQADGKIVVVGAGWLSDFVVMRYNADGSLDTSFGPDRTGKLFTDFGSFQFASSDTAFGVTVQTDGRIVVGGHADSNSNSGSRFALARYNTDGSLDSTFDADGKVTTDFGSGIDLARAVAVQADGRIIAAGSTVSGFDFALARYNADGSLDSSFGDDGKVTTDFGGDEAAFGVALQPDGRIVAAGRAGSGGSDFAVARYNADGSLDTAFDADGIGTTDFSAARGCTIIGTSSADNLTGTSRSDVICALGGDDTIHTGSGSDIVYGGSGDDAIEGGSGADTLNGGPGNDTLDGGSGKDRIDTVDYVSGNDHSDGGPGNDTCITDTGDLTTSCP